MNFQLDMKQKQTVQVNVQLAQPLITESMERQEEKVMANVGVKLG